MKIAWLLLFTLLLVYLLDPAECWRRRRMRFRVRVRVRRVLPRVRVRRILPRVRVRRIRLRLRRVLPRIRIRRVLPRFEIPRLRIRLRRLVDRRRDNPYPVTRTPAPPRVTQGQYPNTTIVTPDPCPEICAGKCPLPAQCSTWNCPCQWVCATTCDWFTEEEFLWPYEGYAIPLPCDFEQYDGDADGGISPAELAFMVRMRSRDQNNLIVFNKMDLDQDGSLTSEEFYSFLLLKDCESAEQLTTSQNATVFLSRK